MRKWAELTLTFDTSRAFAAPLALASAGIVSCQRTPETGKDKARGQVRSWASILRTSVPDLDGPYKPAQLAGHR